MKRIYMPAAVALTAVLPAAALAAGVIETALTQAQSAIVASISAMIVGGLMGWVVGRVDARANAALAKAEEDLTLTDKIAIELDRRLDQIDRDHLQKVIDNVLASNLDRVLSKAGVPPKAAADGFVDDLYRALSERNPQLAGRVETYLDREKAKDLIAAGIGRIFVRDALTTALEQIPGVLPGSRR